MSRPKSVPSLNLNFIRAPPDPRVRAYYESKYQSGPPLPATPASTASPAASVRSVPSPAASRPASPGPSVAVSTHPNANASAAKAASGDAFFRNSQRSAYSSKAASPASRSTAGDVPIQCDPSFYAVPAVPYTPDPSRPPTPSPLGQGAVLFDPPSLGNDSDSHGHMNHPRPLRKLSPGFGAPPPAPMRASASKKRGQLGSSTAAKQVHNPPAESQKESIKIPLEKDSKPQRAAPPRIDHRTSSAGETTKSAPEKTEQRDPLVDEFKLNGPEIDRTAPIIRIMPKKYHNPVEAWGDQPNEQKNDIPDILRQSANVQPAIVTDPSDRVAQLSSEIVAALESGQYERASNLQTQKLACYRVKYPKNSIQILDAHLDLADIYLKRGLAHQAKDHFDRAERIHTSIMNSTPEKSNIRLETIRTTLDAQELSDF